VLLNLWSNRGRGGTIAGKMPGSESEKRRNGRGDFRDGQRQGYPKTFQGDKVGQPFFTAKHAGHGMGPGLSISKGIVAAHGWHLNLHAECEHAICGDVAEGSGAAEGGSRSWEVA
jgi:hypothetical protein